VVAVTPASLVVAAALLAWGPVSPPVETPAAESAEPAPAPAETVQPAAPAAAAPAPPPPVATTIIAKAPVDVRARPTLVAAPAAHREPHKPLVKQPAFWVLAGGFLAATIVVTIIATRPAPEAYRGNAPPYYMPFP
jgi:hypothetical protein